MLTQRKWVMGSLREIVMKNADILAIAKAKSEIAIGAEIEISLFNFVN